MIFAQIEGADILKTKEFRAVPGKGITATVKENEVTIGKPSFIEEEGMTLFQAV